MIYLWNDLFLLDCEKARLIDNLISMFNLKNKSNTIKYLTSYDFLDWRNLVKSSLETDKYEIFTIGKRFKDVKSIANLNPKRIRDDSGKLLGMKFLEEYDFFEIKKKSLSDEVYIIEDVSVTGATLDFTLDALIKSGFGGKVYFYLFICSEQAQKHIIKKYQEKISVEFKCKYLFYEKPIEEVTLLCLYDYLREEIGEKTYREFYRQFRSYALQDAKEFDSFFKFFEKITIGWEK